MVINGDSQSFKPLFDVDPGHYNLIKNPSYIKYDDGLSCNFI